MPLKPKIKLLYAFYNAYKKSGSKKKNPALFGINLALLRVKSGIEAAKTPGNPDNFASCFISCLLYTSDAADE